MPNTGSPSLAVIVPATDRPPTLDRCLAALRASTEPPDELVVVTEPAGAGPAEARNAGVASSSSDLVAFVDADVVVEGHALERLRAAFAAEPGLAAAFGSYDDAPDAPGTVSRFRNLLHHHVHVSSPGPAETFWGGLGAVRRDAFEAAGRFDAERFQRPSVEDIDLGMRLRAAGATIVLDPDVRGTHLKRWTLRSMVETDLLRRGIPWTRLQLESGRASGALNLGWRHRIGALSAVVAAAAAFARRPLVALAALAAMVAANLSFYRLLERRGGVGLASAGVLLHLVHHLTAVAGAIAGVVGHLLEPNRRVAR